MPTAGLRILAPHLRRNRRIANSNPPDGAMQHRPLDGPVARRTGHSSAVDTVEGRGLWCHWYTGTMLHHVRDTPASRPLRHITAHARTPAEHQYSSGLLVLVPRCPHAGSRPRFVLDRT